MTDDREPLAKPPRFDQNPDADTSGIAEGIGAKVEHGEMSSPAAQAYWRETILHPAKCPICGQKKLKHLILSGETDGGETRQLAFGLPVIVPGRADLASVGALQYAACQNCGYLASFLDLSIIARHQKAQSDE